MTPPRGGVPTKDAPKGGVSTKSQVGATKREAHHCGQGFGDAQQWVLGFFLNPSCLVFGVWARKSQIGAVDAVGVEIQCAPSNFVTELFEINLVFALCCCIYMSWCIAFYIISERHLSREGQFLDILSNFFPFSFCSPQASA